jgi:hypothetical protein
VNDKFARRQKELEMAYQNLPKGTSKTIRISSGDSRLQGQESNLKLHEVKQEY